ncbi:DUF5060 domain-containing protein [Planctomycetota bacterium]
MQSTKVLSVVMCVMGMFFADATAAAIAMPAKVPESMTEKESAQEEPAKLIYSGRLAVSHDGNIHDTDDWGALAFVWGIVASFGMQEKLVHVDHSDHLVDNTARGEKQMILSAEGWKYFPGFDSSVVFSDWRDLEGAIANFKKQAEAGSETDMLSYMCAGPMDVPWQCINAVTPSKRKFIRVISHSGWNNSHTWKNPDGSKSHTWKDMVSSFSSDGVKFEKIAGQNTHLGPDDSDWSFLNNMPNDTCIPASAWEWMFSREQRHSDVSDCGMTWYCLTGDVSGTDKKFEARFKHPIAPTTDVAVTAEPAAAKPAPPKMVFTDPEIRKPDGDGRIDVGGELRQWHKVSLTLNGPYAHERDTQPNPFTDYRMTVTFKHESGEPVYQVPGYFAADGKAGESGADCGTSWRAHLSPDKTGKWSYSVQFAQGSQVALGDEGQALKPYDGQSGSFVVRKSNKKGRDFRGQGRLQYVGKHHLQFAGSGKYFLKAGPDSPEVFLAYEDFDGTYTVKNKLKTWEPHLQDAKQGDPTWRHGKGKAILGALNYLSGKGATAFSFLTYNAGGDGDNIWPFVERDAKFHYDCSKLDQWQIVFDHAQKLGLYLHFKMQETENDDNTKGAKGVRSEVPASLDNGDLGPERKLYCRELIARFGYELALNWNLGEENTQSTEQQEAMAAYIDKIDVFNHNIVVHSFPPWQDRVYNPLLGNKYSLTGASLQNHWHHTHTRTLQWIAASAAAGKPWIIANDEQGPHQQGVPLDPGYQGFDPETLDYDLHDIRKQTLWGNLMAGGAGVEYYFGYKLAQSDLSCEDYRSRDQSWDYCNIALTFFDQQKIPFQDMVNANALIGNADNGQDKYCLAQEGEIYLVYLGYVPTTEIDLSEASGNFKVRWFNPRSGGKLASGSVKRVQGGSKVALGDAPSDPDEDWLVILRK